MENYLRTIEKKFRKSMLNNKQKVIDKLEYRLNTTLRTINTEASEKEHEINVLLDQMEEKLDNI